MARRGSNIYLRKDGRWEARYVKDRKDGKTYFGYVYGRSRQEAREKQSLARSRWIAGIRAKQERAVRLGTVSEEWLSVSEAQLKPSTIAKYRDYLRCYIFPVFGEKKISEISDADVSGFCSELLKHGGRKGKGLSPKIVSEIFRVMKHLRAYAVSRRYEVGYSPDCVRIRQKQHELRVLTPAEQERLQRHLEASEDPTCFGILLCLFTGMRIGELCGLTWDDISPEDRELRVRRTLQRISCHEPDGSKTKIVITSPKSEHSRRIIPLPEGLCARLAAEKRPGAVFLTGEADRHVEPRTMLNRFKSILAECNIEDAKFHALRHTFATKWVEKGLDVKCLSAILGHSTVNITLSRYVHPSMALKMRNMEQMVSPF